jgi:CheY-like chemotaxis protein
VFALVGEALTMAAKSKPRVLWIEDSARLELRNLVGPLFFSSKYDFNLAEDVTSAMRFLRDKEYDAVIVDIRLPPGIDPQWSQWYRQTGFDKVHAQLGLKLLRWLLAKDDTIHPDAPPAWIDAHRVAVFTVESKQEIQNHLDELGIQIFQQKSAGLRDTTLLELIDQILAQGRATENCTNVFGETGAT